MFPIIGPILSLIGGAVGPLFTWLNKKADVDLGKAQVKGKTDIAQIEASQQEQDNRTSIALAYKNDLGNILNRDLIMFSVSVHIALVAYVSTFKNLIPDYTWTVESFPGTLGYVPYAVIAWLFAISFKNLFR